MKKVLILIVCLVSLACSKSVTIEGGSNNGNSSTGQSGAVAQSASSPTAQSIAAQTGGPVTFSIVQPMGQKSDYESRMVMKMNMENPAPNQPPVEMVVNVGMDLHTEVTAMNPDGSWTMKSRVSNMKTDATMNGQPVPMPQQSQGVEDKTYTATYDKSGKLKQVTGLGSSQQEQSVKQMLEQMNPAQFLPNRPVKVGDTWPINFDMPTPAGGAGPTQSVVAKGTGRFTEVVNGQARLDYDLTIEMSGQVTASGSGKSTMSYDLEKSRMSTFKMDFAIDMSGAAPSPRGGQQIKGKMNMDMQMNLKN